jgi:CheY-like chemotaxis protein
MLGGRRMQDGPRLLVAAALGKIIEPFLRQSMRGATVWIAEDKGAVERAVTDRPRFDVVVADLTWNDYAIEYSFDGLDVLDILRSARRQAPVIFAAQGHGIERDHLDEAVDQPEVVGIYRKATGPQPLVEAVDIAARGGNLMGPQFPPGDSPHDIPRIHKYFSKGKGVLVSGGGSNRQVGGLIIGNRRLELGYQSAARRRWATPTEGMSGSRRPGVHDQLLGPLVIKGHCSTPGWGNRLGPRCQSRNPCQFRARWIRHRRKACRLSRATHT